METVAKLYQDGDNVMAFFRELNRDRETNTLDAILVSYDLQAGSYTRTLETPAYASFMERFSTAVAALMDGFAPESILEAGVGEASTFVNVLLRMKRRPVRCAGFDLSWSRALYARKYARKSSVQADLAVGNLMSIPSADASFDVVYTSDAVEPNHGRELDILKELYRVARRYVVLLEPSYELGSEETRAHIREHGYCRNLRGFAEELGYKVVEHRLFDHTFNPKSQTGLLVIEKDAPPFAGGQWMACPICKRPLTAAAEHLYCEQCRRIYPVLRGIPCLLPENGVLGSKYLEAD
jgi:ubiquinone/menaquinone biosynthesis C-methylase UbiE